MVTNAEKKDTEETGAKVEHVVRSVIAGHPDGAIRRIVLYSLLLVGIVLIYLLGNGGGLTGAALLGTLFIAYLLGSTDQLA